MDEILREATSLAQDQYGNYVVQHVLQHGGEDERKTILQTLAGQIVLLAQHKFASNVIKKCLTYCGASERQIMIDEMLGKTDENEPLQAIMKDQFANYVVQKLLEVCDDGQRDQLLTRMRVHLGNLKKFTYGKHIVARVEKFVASASTAANSAGIEPAATATASEGGEDQDDARPAAGSAETGFGEEGDGGEDDAQLSSSEGGKSGGGGAEAYGASADVGEPAVSAS